MRDRVSRRKDFKNWYLQNRKSKKQYKPYEDFGRDIKSQKDGYYTLLRMIIETAKDDHECFKSGRPPAGQMGAHKLKDGSYQYPGILKEDPLKEIEESFLIQVVKESI